MIKKIIATILAIMIIMPIAFSQEGEGVNSVSSISDREILDEREIRMLQTRTGAEMRLGMLEARLENQVESAQTIIRRIENSYPNFDTSRLVYIVSEMRLLIEEIENIDYSQDPQILAREYVRIKGEATSLTNVFREQVHFGLERNSVERIRSEVLEIRERAVEDRALMSERERRALELKRAYNAEIASDKMQRIQRLNTSFIEEIRRGEIAPMQIETRIRTELNELSESQREIANERLMQRDRLLEEQKRERERMLREEALRAEREREMMLRQRIEREAQTRDIPMQTREREILEREAQAQIREREIQEANRISTIRSDDSVSDSDSREVVSR